jgi:hypothetical protein
LVVPETQYRSRNVALVFGVRFMHMRTMHNVYLTFNSEWSLCDLGGKTKKNPGRDPHGHGNGNGNGTLQRPSAMRHGHVRVYAQLAARAHKTRHARSRLGLGI